MLINVNIASHLGAVLAKIRHCLMIIYRRFDMMSTSICINRSFLLGTCATLIVMSGLVYADIPVAPPADASGGDFLSADQQGSGSATRLFNNTKVIDPTQKKGWSGQALAGLVLSTGNTESSSLTAGLTVRHVGEKWRHTGTGNLYFAENAGTRIAERYGLSHKLDYLINPQSYAFNFVSYDKDEFANIKDRVADVVGYGRKLINTDKHTLNVEIGGGARKTTYTSTAEKSNEAVKHFGLKYAGRLTKNTTLTEDILVQAGNKNTFSESVTALNVAMSQKVMLSVSYTVRNNSKVLGTLKKADTITSVNLVTNF